MASQKWSLKAVAAATKADDTIATGSVRFKILIVLYGSLVPEQCCRTLFMLFDEYFFIAVMTFYLFCTVIETV